jgi:TolB-like protein/DNA-binding winged helix-turn-helix (wHTH) protein/Flp pilus assembly protein TadD
LRAAELRQNGSKIKLPEQPFQILCELVEHAGQVVTREELRQRLWQSDTFVDFEHGLNTAVKRLRELLGDSAEHPRYIETLPRHGYRLMVPVEMPKRAIPQLLRVQRVIWLSLAAVLVLTIAASLIWRERLLERFRPVKIESLAVLPLENLSGNPDEEYFADGMTEALITELGKFHALRVISWQSVKQFKGTNKSVPQIAQELHVDAVIEGATLRSAGRVRITAQLVLARPEHHLWSESYERTLGDVISLQDEIAQAILRKIKVHVTPEESQLPMAVRRVDPEVYDATLKGKAVLEYATREGQVRQAIELFQEAIDRDPTYAPAWAGLGEALWYLAATGLELVAPADVHDKAIAAAEKALELDGTLPDAHQARAVIAIDAEWDLAKAQRHFEKVLELRPSQAAAHNLYGQILAAPLGHFDEARRHVDRARELDPLSPWNDINLLGWWIHQGRPEKTLEEGQRARLRNPTLWTIPCLMGFAQLLLGQPERAVPEFETALKLLYPERPSSVLAPLGLAYGLAGRRAEALKILSEMELAAQKRYTSPFYLAVVYSGLGRMDEAFRLLDRALEQRTPYLIFCTPNDGNSIALRRDPRWKHFTERLRPLVTLPPGTPDPYS